MTAKKDGTPRKGKEIAVREAPVPAGRGDDVASSVADAVLLPLRVARHVMPENRAPMVLGVAALTLVGVLELPTALGVGLAWEALRRWGPA